MASTTFVKNLGKLNITTRLRCEYCGKPIVLRTTEQTTAYTRFPCEHCGAIYTITVRAHYHEVVKPWVCWRCGETIRPNVTHDTSACAPMKTKETACHDCGQTVWCSLEEGDIYLCNACLVERNQKEKA